MKGIESSYPAWEAGNKITNDLFTFYLRPGVRQSELLPPILTWLSINIKRMCIVLIGKRSNKRTVPLHDGLVSILVSRKDNEDPFNFSPDQVMRIIKYYLKKAKILDTSVHIL